MLEDPMGDEGAVAHVGFFDVVAGFDADELGHQPVHHIGIILRFVGFCVGGESQFSELRVGHVVESEQVGTSLFDGRAIGLQGVGVYARKQLARAVPQTLMEVGVKVVAGIAVLINKIARGLVDDELFLEAVAVGSFVVGIRQVADGYALGSVLSTHPVAVGQVDSDGG